MTPTGTDHDPDNLTRKQRRDHAREQRRVQEQERATTEARKRRRMQLGAVAGAVVVAIVVILIATSGSKNAATESSVPKTQSAKNEDVKVVEALVNKIPQKGVTLGSPKAPVTLQYFGDLECPICRQFTFGALSGLILDEVRKGKLKIEYRSMETATREPSTFRAQQIAAYAAGKQDKAWYYIELFYHEQGAEGSNYVNEKFLQGLAQQVPGLKLSQWQSDRADKAIEAKVLADEKAASEIGFSGTPSFMLGKSGGTLKPFTEAGNLESPGPFESAINKLAA
jgi:protein-disulfide isomerase